MSNPPNPGSHSGKSSGSNPGSPGKPEDRSLSPDDEISLDDYDERPQQRPKLPDHRKDMPSFEIGGPGTGAREEPPAPSFGPELFETAPPPPKAEPAAWQPATPDEIANYDLSDGRSVTEKES